MARRLVGRCPFKATTLQHKLAVKATPFLLQYGDGFYGPELQLPAKVAVKKLKTTCATSTASLDLVPTKLAVQQQSQSSQIRAKVKRELATAFDAQDSTTIVTRLDVCSARSVRLLTPSRELYEQLQKITAPARVPTESSSEESTDKNEISFDDEAVDDASDIAKSRETFTTEVAPAAGVKSSGTTNSEDLFSQQVSCAMIDWNGEC